MNNEYEPDYVSSPWETVLELDVKIDELLARVLGDKTGISYQFWLNREKDYRSVKKNV